MDYSGRDQCQPVRLLLGPTDEMNKATANALLFLWLNSAWMSCIYLFIYFLRPLTLYPNIPPPPSLATHLMRAMPGTPQLWIIHYVSLGCHVCQFSTGESVLFFLLLSELINPSTSATSLVGNIRCSPLEVFWALSGWSDILQWP